MNLQKIKEKLGMMLLEWANSGEERVVRLWVVKYSDGTSIHTETVLADSMKDALDKVYEDKQKAIALHAITEVIQ